MLNAREIVTQYRKLLRVHTKLIYRYAQNLRKCTPLARQPQWVHKTSGELGAEWEGGGHERRVVDKFRLY